MPPKRRSSKIAKHKQTVKKRVNPRTHQKLSKAAKGRHRLRGKFASGAIYSHAKLGAEEPGGYASRRESLIRNAARKKGEDPNLSIPKVSKPRPPLPEGEVRAYAQSALEEAKRRGSKTPERDAFMETVAQTGAMPRREWLGEAPVRVGYVGKLEVQQSSREAKWKEAPGLYTYQPATQTGKGKRYIPVSTFMKTEVAPSHRAALEKMLQDPKSAFNKGLPPYEGSAKTGLAPGTRRRLRIYTQRLQEGASHAEALRAIQTDRRGAPGVPKGPQKEILKSEGVRRLGMKQEMIYQGRPTKVVKTPRKPEEMSFGVRAPGVDTAAALAKKFPRGAKETEGAYRGKIVELQQRQRELGWQEIQKNNAWAHETKQANLMGGQTAHRRGPDEVTIFTTSIGKPNVTVPTDSLVGQYVIKKRRGVMQKAGIPPSQLRGRFPEAVRDQHVIEMLSGRSIGAEGAIGGFKRGGWRRGNRKSVGFGERVPVGSQILYDSSGAPLYDKAGNIRYSQGVAKPFRVGTTKELMAGVYLG